MASQITRHLTISSGSDRQHCDVATMNWYYGLVENRHLHMHQAFAAHHTYTTEFFFELWHFVIEKCIAPKYFARNTNANHKKYITLFSPCDK